MLSICNVKLKIEKSQKLHKFLMTLFIHSFNNGKEILNLLKTTGYQNKK